MLAAKSGEPLVHRRVALRWGDEVLSRADNWYLPDRLTPQMNRDLANTDTPFGIIAAPLKFLRRNLAVEALFQPLPEDWERRNPAEFAEPLMIPAAVLRHAAVLTTPDGRAFSFVVETYTDRVLAL